MKDLKSKFAIIIGGIVIFFNTCQVQLAEHRVKVLTEEVLLLRYETSALVMSRYKYNNNNTIVIKPDTQQTNKSVSSEK